MQYIQRIEELLKNRKITAKKMLLELGYADSLISHWKKGSEPSAIKLQRIAEFLNTSVDYLLTGERGKDLNEDEKKLLTLYSSLNEKRKGKAELFIEQLSEEQEQEEIKNKDVG